MFLNYQLRQTINIILLIIRMVKVVLFSNIIDIFNFDHSSYFF